MADFVAYNSNWRLALLFVLAVGFAVAGLMLVGTFGEVPTLLEEPRRSRFPSWFSLLIGWVIVFFFGSSALVIGKNFLDHKPQLYTCATGIIVVSWSDKQIPWSEVSEITTWIHKCQKAIILHLKNPDRFPGRGLAGKLSGFNRIFTGGDVAISLLGTNRNFDEAMAAMLHFRSVAPSD